MDTGTILLMRHAEKPVSIFRRLAPKGPRSLPATFRGPSASRISCLPRRTRRIATGRWKPSSRWRKRAAGRSIPRIRTTAPALGSELLSRPHFEGKRIVVWWHHEKIPHFAQALGAGEGGYPHPWDPEVFNLILQFGFRAGKLTVAQITEPF